MWNRARRTGYRVMLLRSVAVSDTDAQVWHCMYIRHESIGQFDQEA